jgi:type VI secretion system protein
MPMLITIIKAPDSVSNAGLSQSFDAAGGTIGRGDDNTWVLDDPECYLSSCHCQISYENGCFNITDQSTNGTFYNGSADPMGKGTKLPINDKDTFVVGDYEFSISLENAAAEFDAPSGGPFDSPPPGSQQTPFGGGHVPSSDSPYIANPAETDPLAALDKAQGGGNQLNPAAEFDGGTDPWSGPSHSDQANPLNQQISWPEPLQGQESVVGGAIPDNWDEDLSLPSTPVESQSANPPPVQPSTPLTEPPLVPKPGGVSARANEAQHSIPGENVPVMDTGVVAPPPVQQFDQTPQTGVVAEQPPAPSQPDANNLAAVDKTLINILGFQNKNLSDEQITQINQLSAEVLREMVIGLMQVLGSRSAIKNEFRMNVTTIQPVENNPLKFSANVEDALENMFIKQGNAYKKPIEAVRDGFEGIAEHQVAILAGIREAFKGVVERFDPVVLEQRFSKQKKGGLIPGSQKAKFWKSYQEYYTELVGDMDRSFQYLYGDEFVRAYESQLQKLALARKADKQK